MHDFRVWLRHQHYSEQTIRQYVNYCRRAHQALGTLNHQDTDTLSQWVWSLSDSCGIGARKALIAWYDHKRTKHNPATPIRVARRPAGKPRPLTLEERDRFLQAADELGGVHRVVGYLFEFTGARYSSVRFAHWRGFDFNHATWTFAAKGTNRSGPRTHTIPLHPALVDVLRAWRTRTPGLAVLPGPCKGVISESRLRELHDDICEHARLEHVVPHQHRHTVATLAYEATGDIAAVSDLLGHANIGTTKQVYTQTSMRRVRAAIEGLPLAGG